VTTTTAYLTVDDAPSPRLSELLDTLEHLGVPALLFCEGAKLERRPEAAVDAVERGFHLGNHAYSHPQFSEVGLSRARAEVRRTDRLLDAVYERAGVERPTRAFRFPYGDHGAERSPDHVAALQGLLRSEGYDAPTLPGVTYDWWAEDVADRPDWFWTFDPREYRDDHERADVVARIRDSERLAGDSTDVVLLHDHAETTDDVGAYLRALRDAGVRFAPPPV
jgi:peptidoglycan/xylan/chitin deacetylase (PgdA/CDA1 family)